MLVFLAVNILRILMLSSGSSGRAIRLLLPVLNYTYESTSPIVAHPVQLISFNVNPNKDPKGRCE
jgi:hypothetical protein